MGCELIFEELGICLEMLEDKVCKVLKIVKEFIFMEMSIGDDEDLYLGDFIEDVIIDLFVDFVMIEGLMEVIWLVLVGLIVREVKVFSMCFGIDMNMDYILEEVGK